MINPEGPKVPAYNTCIRSIKRFQYERDLYPPHVIRRSEESETPPRCIFVPDRALVRTLIIAVLKRDVFDTEE